MTNPWTTNISDGWPLTFFLHFSTSFCLYWFSLQDVQECEERGQGPQEHRYEEFIPTLLAPIGDERRPDAPASSIIFVSTRVKVLLKTGNLGLKTRREKEVFQQLKNKDFIHTPTLDPILLQETGLETEFDLIFQMVGWTNFWDITELGSCLLTIEFLCTLQYYEGGIAFRMFKQDIMLSCRKLSDHLGFFFKMHLGHWLRLA